jgi:hypothetical protein
MKYPISTQDEVHMAYYDLPAPASTDHTRLSGRVPRDGAAAPTPTGDG